MWNTFFTLALIPEVDVKVRPSPDQAGRSSMSIFVIVLFIVVSAIVIAVALFATL